jgi:endonuclease/exonuclease/phosphatase (EEP) superfamily protein YafD
MRPLAALAAATAIELCLAPAALTGLGVGGFWNGWLDLVNVAAPLTLAVTGVGVLAARAALPRGRTRTVCQIVAIAAAAANLVMFGPELATLSSAASPAAGKTYRIVSANLYRENDRPFRAVSAVVAEDADAVMTLETDGTASRVRQLLEKAYPYRTVCGSGDVRIWLKRPILQEGCGLALAHVQPKWGEAFAWVRTEGPDGRPIVLAAVHLGRPYPPARQDLERRGLAKAMAGGGLSTPETILAGDFNTVPWSMAMIRQDGMLAGLRRLTGAQPTFPAENNLLRTAWPLPFLPIDHIYAGRRWRAQRVRSFRIPGSDHMGVEADLRLAP